MSGSRRVSTETGRGSNKFKSVSLFFIIFMPQLTVMIPIVVMKITTTPTLLYDGGHPVLWPGVLLLSEINVLIPWIGGMLQDLTAFGQLFII